jgi:two-component system, sensor histidine kinase PdtaS
MLTLKPPKTEYSSMNDVGKFNMMWNVSLVLIPIFIILFGMHIYFEDPSWVTSLAAMFVGLGNVLLLYKTRKYKLLGIVSTIVGVLICQTVIFLVNDSHLASDVMWCVLVGIFAFFLLGGWIGTIVLLLNLTGLIVFLMFGSSEDILNKGIQVEAVNYKMVINVYYVALALAFIVYKMIANNDEVNKRYEREIARNELLLKEIHHRVKNNLQIVSSLLKLQAADTENSVVKVQFDEAIGRIRSMALIHEKMYNNDDLSKIKIEPYLIALAEDICASLCSDGNLEMNVKSDIDKVDVKSIVPISLIFNELMTNSMKNGFAGLTSGKIDVEINTKGSHTEFIYRDNGTWKEPAKEDTFGLELLNTLTEQLEGTLVRTFEKGTMYTFSFPTLALYFKKEENQD